MTNGSSCQMAYSAWNVPYLRSWQPLPVAIIDLAQPGLGYRLQTVGKRQGARGFHGAS